MDETTWIGTRDACERLGVTLRTLYRLIDTRDVPAYRIGRPIRLRESDVVRFVRRDDGEADGDGGALVPTRPRPTGGSLGAARTRDDRHMSAPGCPP